MQMWFSEYHTVNVKLDVFLRVLRLQIEHLSDDKTRSDIIDFLRQENDTIIEQARKNIIRSFTAAGLLYNIRH